MPLVLAPSFDAKTREQIEAHLEEVRGRRLVAAMEFHAGRHAKLSHESDKVQRQLAKAYEMLGKELDKFDALDQKIMDRLEKCEQLKQEIGLITDLIELHPAPTEQED